MDKVWWIGVEVKNPVRSPKGFYIACESEKDARKFVLDKCAGEDPEIKSVRQDNNWLALQVGECFEWTGHVVGAEKLPGF